MPQKYKLLHGRNVNAALKKKKNLTFKYFYTGAGDDVGQWLMYK